MTACCRRSTVITWYRKSMAAVTPPAASMMKHSPRKGSKSSPYRKLMTGMPIHPMMTTMTSVSATTMANMMTTMMMSNRRRFSGSAHASAMRTSSGLYTKPDSQQDAPGPGSTAR